MKKISIIGGLGFGDEGKGAVTDYLVRRDSAGLVVRYNGGAQAAHNVVTADGRSHTFSQFGSGTLAGARTFLSRHMLVEPHALMVEANVLRGKGIPNPLGLINIDPACIVITRYHRYSNQYREEQRGDKRHGSVGVGVGEARSDALEGRVLRFGDLNNSEAALEMLKTIAEHKRNEFPQCDSLNVIDPETVLRELQALRLSHLAMSWEQVVSNTDSSVVFEGAQGLLLDEELGFAPHNTWTDCTFNNAESLLEEVGCDPSWAEKIGIIRSYYTRHGMGPFPTEDPSLNVPEVNNKTEKYMGAFRVGHFDGSAIQYAIRYSNFDYIALTHCDRRPSKKVGWYGAIPHSDTDFMRKAVPQYSDFESLSDWIRGLGVSVLLKGYGPTAKHYEV